VNAGHEAHAKSLKLLRIIRWNHFEMEPCMGAMMAKVGPVHTALGFGAPPR
jgi:hypothetical protein